MTFRADLHCHSTISDGTMSPSELVTHAIEKGLSGLAITDHDTAGAYPAVFEEGKKQGLRLITGSEFSTVHKGVSIHILAYGFNPNHPIIQELTLWHKERRQDRNDKILSALKIHGMNISAKELEESTTLSHTIGRPHIANLMIQKGYCKTTQDAFKRFLSEGRPGYVEGVFKTTEDTLELLKDAGALVFLAHPHLIERSKIARSLLELSFNGLECYYGNFPANRHTKWVEAANKKEWLISGGSDFHGSIKPHIALGCSWTPKETFEHLERHTQEQLKLM